MVVHVCSPSCSEVEPGGPEDQGRLSYTVEFRANLNYPKPLSQPTKSSIVCLCCDILRCHTYLF